MVNNAVKAGVLLSLLGICAFGVYGAVQIEARYDPRWYLRPSSYQAQFLRALGRYFPDEGVDVQVYVGTSTTTFEGSVIITDLQYYPVGFISGVQGSAKEWFLLGCVIPRSWLPLAARARFTQPRVHSLTDPCMLQCPLLGEIKYWEHLDEMYGIHDAIKNNSYTNTESVNYWFPKFYHGYCEKDSNSTEVGQGRGGSADDEDDFWGEFGDGGNATDKTFEVEDCTNGEKFIHVALLE